MLDDKQLRSFSQLPPPLLTAYVNSNPGKPSNRGPSAEYLTWLNSAGKAAASELPPDQQELFNQQRERVRTFLRDRVSLPKAVVIFAGADVWTYIPLQVEVENELHWGKPFLFPLLALVSRHQPFVVVVVDRSGARFFRYRLGEMVELEQRKFEIDVSQWRKKDLGKVAPMRESSFAGSGEVTKSRGSARDTFEHRVDAQYQRLFGETAERIRVLAGETGRAGLFLVGSNRLIDPIAAALPSELRARAVMIGEDLGRISSSAIEQRIEPAIAQWEQTRETEAVDALLGNAGAAVTGLDATLAQLQQGRVGVLMVARRFRGAVRQCAECGWTDRASQDVCPACGGRRQTADLREALPELAWRHGAGMEVVGAEAAIRLANAGGIAGRLRPA